jgi:hypothetical protein
MALFVANRWHTPSSDQLANRFALEWDADRAACVIGERGSAVDAEELVGNLSTVFRL